MAEGNGPCQALGLWSNDTVLNRAHWSAVNTILQGSTVLNNNLFHLFILLMLIRGKNVTLLICNHSSVWEFPPITDITKGDRLTWWVKLVAWLLFATPEQLGFFQGIGLLDKPTDCTVQIPKTEEEDAKHFKIIGDPIIHITTNVINHCVTVVFEAKKIICWAEGNKPEELRPQVVILKVWHHVGFSTGNPQVRKSHTILVRTVTAPIMGVGTHCTHLAMVWYKAHAVWYRTYGTEGTCGILILFNVIIYYYNIFISCSYSLS